MAASIGIRAYSIKIRRKGEAKPLPFRTGDLIVPFTKILRKFLKDCSKPISNNELERSWYIEEKKSGADGGSQGYIHYGTFGFESNFIDNKTATKRYRRLVTDIEEIPLYYEFWLPARCDYGLVAFQSFQGRSCIQILIDKMKEIFETNNPGFTVSFSKLMHNDSNSSPYANASVKRIRLIRRKAPGDLADRYLGKNNVEEIDLEVGISARPRKNLGKLGALLRSMTKERGGLFEGDSAEFSEAVADIKIGARTRRVGILGYNSDAGVIDITADVKRGPDGHPTFPSLVKEVDEILKEFHSHMNGEQI